MKSDAPTFKKLREAYLSGETTPRQVMRATLARIAAAGERPVWIRVLTEKELEPWLQWLEASDPAGLPLYGIPFGIKDNIDLVGIPTTAACPEYAYTPVRSAFVVDALIRAGAIPVGKTNLDQFATGLVGVRSPYGVCHSVFNKEFISGGSSSGSAVAVARGDVLFSLGTDTAGSGRVPAAFNGLVGLKPTRGRLSTGGVVPACRSLDCVSIFTRTVAEAETVLEAAQQFDPADPFSRRTEYRGRSGSAFTFGVPAPALLEFFGDCEGARLFEEAAQRLEAFGGTRKEIDFQPFRETADLLYQGPWVAERFAAVGDFMKLHPEAMHPVVGEIIAKAKGISARATFEGVYRLAELRRSTTEILATVDCLLLPTAPTIYRIAEVVADPIRLNARLGYYTNFANLLDLAAVSVPAGVGRKGLPFGVTFMAPAWHESRLLELGARFTGGQAANSLPQEGFDVAVLGAHLEGQPLNRQLTDLGARFLRKSRTKPCYRMYLLDAQSPPKPGLVREEGFRGPGIELEVWRLPMDQAARFIQQIPAPLGIGTLELEDGAQVKGFLCESGATVGRREITGFGGWRAYLAG